MKLTKMFKMKQGNLLDPLEVGITLLGVILVLFIIITINTNMGAGFRANNQTNVTDILDRYDSYNSRLKSGVDYGFLLIIVGLPIVSFILARKIPTDTVYFIFLFFISGFVVLLMMIFSNIYGKLLESTLFSDFMATLVIAPKILPYLPYYALVYILIVFIGLFTKTDAI